MSTRHDAPRPIRIHPCEESRSRLYDKVQRLLYVDRSYEEAADEALLLLDMYCYAVWGEQVICPSAGLAEALQKTEPPEGWALPYPAFYIAFESPVVFAGQPLEGVYVVTSSSQREAAKMYLEFPAVHRLILGKIPEGSALAVVGIAVGGVPVQAAPEIASFIKNLCAYLEALGPSSTDTSRPQRKKALQAKANKAGPKKKRKLQRQADKASGATIVYLGTGYTSPSSTDNGEPPDTRRSHWVRGHWRNQPYGFGRRLRRQKWIQPHQRCTDNPDPPVPGRTYRITE